MPLSEFIVSSVVVGVLYLALIVTLPIFLIFNLFEKLISFKHKE
jgi:hypothetical protein